MKGIYIVLRSYCLTCYNCTLQKAQVLAIVLSIVIAYNNLKYLNIVLKQYSVYIIKISGNGEGVPTSERLAKYLTPALHQCNSF
jgi:hypothetical protein